MDQLMRTERVPDVALRPEQRPTPKGRQLRKVLRPIDPGDVVEHRAEEVVLCDVAIEALHHLGDIAGIEQIMCRPERRARRSKHRFWGMASREHPVRLAVFALLF